MLALGPLLLPALVGCGGAAGTVDGVTFNPCAPLALVPDSSATPAQATGVAAALALWNGMAASRLSVTAAPPADSSSVPVHFQEAAPPLYGFYDPKAGAVFINEDLGDAPLAVTIAHEVGHAFGLVHVPSETRASVMNPGNLSVTPTGADVAALTELWGQCPPVDPAAR